ncbi:hypothetical protein [Streptomyces longhuiensis]|uniref:hypothetical protein n=1 Tax=Streptomyces longhuiensis TaxID=2880933 RepID=UPI001D0AB5AE|nr:hypothetical protein [Streptomyces longhuiensis]UDM05589.1 hypothetical protein LGI35_45935 [Streptomyces longhuiensis]
MVDRRYRLTLTTTAGRTIMDGRWSNLATAERKFRSWIGSYSAIPSARIALAEQAADATWTELKAWPDSEA